MEEALEQGLGRAGHAGGAAGRGSWNIQQGAEDAHERLVLHRERAARLGEHSGMALGRLGAGCRGGAAANHDAGGRGCAAGRASVGSEESGRGLQLGDAHPAALGRPKPSAGQQHVLIVCNTPPRASEWPWLAASQQQPLRPRRCRRSVAGTHPVAQSSGHRPLGSQPQARHQPTLYPLCP